MPDLRSLPRAPTRGHPEFFLKKLDVLAHLGSLRLPSVARLKFTPYLMWGRNDDLFDIE